MEDSENAESGPIPKNDENPSIPGKSCALCGCTTPAVRCDRCSSQIFCLSCDDMYHRHPKRRLHLRKAVDSIWSSSRSPRLRRRTDLPGDPSKIPIPPPRSKKRERHTVGGRMFMKPGMELGSFGHSKKFDMKNLVPPSNDGYSKPNKTPKAAEDTYENETVFPVSHAGNTQRTEEIYENDNVINQAENIATHGLDHSPWNSPRQNISPIQVSIPSSTPEMISNGQSLGFPQKNLSRSITDLASGAVSPGGHPAYHFPHPYPYMHPPVHPPYSHSMAHLNCAQCMSSSWSNLVGSHPSPYFHPLPWGPPTHPSLARGGHAAPHGQLKHSHGDLGSYPDPNFHFPYPAGAYYPNGLPVADPNSIRDLHQQAMDIPKVKRSPSSSRSSRHAQSTEDLHSASAMPAAESITHNPREVSSNNSADQDKQEKVEEEPIVPVPPKGPWSCLHCTFINPPGIYICQVCCKTSYGNKPPSESEENMNDSPMPDGRNSESPMELVNMDAEIMSAEFTKYKAQKVI